MVFRKEIIVFLLFCVFYNINAQEESDSIDINILSGISIEILKERNEGIIPHQKLSGEQLENMNSLSVADAIRYFSGAQLKDYGGIGGMKTIDIRSMGTKHVGVFYDGIQLGNAQNATVDLGRFSLDNIESISLFNGQRSEILQPAKDYSTASGIYLKSRIPKFKDRKYNLEFKYRSGSFSLINPSILLENKISKNISSSFNIEYLNSDGKYKFREKSKYISGNTYIDTVGIRKNGQIESYRIEGALYGKLNSGSWHLKSQYYNSDRGIPGPIVKNVYNRHEKQWDKNFFIQSSLNKNITPKYEISLNGKYAYDYMHYVNRDLDFKHTDNEYKQHELYFSLAQKYKLFDFWDIGLSTDYQFNKLNSDLEEFAYPKRNTELIAFATSLDFNKLKLQANVLGTFIQETIKNTGRTKKASDKKEFTPAFFISYRPFKNGDLEFHSFYKRIFRLPTFNDLYYTEIGNSQLSPEYTNQYDIGINYNKDFYNETLKNIDITIDTYYNKVEDKIIALPKDQFRWSMLNLGEVRIKGISTSVNTVWKISKDFLLRTQLNYTYEEAQDITNRKDFYYKDQIPYAPWNSGSAILGLSYKDWNINYSFIYTGERYDALENKAENYRQSWYTSDLSIFKEFKIKSLKAKTGLELINLFNQHFDVLLNYPMPGRNYRFSLKLNI